MSELSSQTEAQFVLLRRLYADPYTTGYTCNHSFLHFSLFVMEEFAVVVHLTERYELGKAFKVFSEVSRQVSRMIWLAFLSTLFHITVRTAFLRTTV